LTVTPAFLNAVSSAFVRPGRSLIFSGLTPTVTTGCFVTMGLPAASTIGERSAATRRTLSLSPALSSLLTMAGSQITRQPSLPCFVIRTVLSYDHGRPPGSVQSSLTALDAMSPVTLALPWRVNTSGVLARSPERLCSWSTTSRAGMRLPSAVTNPTLSRLPLRQPARNSSSVSAGPSLPHAATPPARSTVAAPTPTARRRRPRAGCGERRMSSPPRGTDG
jgi:hypothetical protein